MAVVPIEHPREREQRVLLARVCSVPDKGIYPGFVEGEPLGIQVCYDCRGVDEVACTVSKASEAVKRDLP